MKIKVANHAFHKITNYIVAQSGGKYLFHKTVGLHSIALTRRIVKMLEKSA